MINLLCISIPFNRNTKKAKLSQITGNENRISVIMRIQRI